MGVDERNQFQLLSDLPGGLGALKAAVDRFHARGVRVGMPYNPWDTDTARPNVTDAQALADLTAAVGADWVNGDTMTFMSPDIFTDAIDGGHPVALQPEGGPELKSLNWTQLGWGYWSNPFVPGVDIGKWVVSGAPDLEPGRGHHTNICNRWETNHTSDLQQAWFNGIGFVSWENVWGIWNGLTDRDAEATRRVGAMSRFLHPFLVSQAWEPHTVLHGDAASVGLFASRWPLAASGSYSHNATLWTVVNRGGLNYTGPVVLADCPASASGTATAYFDIYRGVAVTPQAIKGATGATGCAVNLSVEAEGFGGLLALDPSDAGNGDLTAFLATMGAMTRRSLASYSASVVYLQQAMTDWGRTTPPASPPGDMTLIPGATNWTFVVNGTEIEPWYNPAYGVDVQYPWEDVSIRRHEPHVMDVPPFYMDTTPVTNGAFAAFLSASEYVPSDNHNFLLDWNCTGAPCDPPAGWADKPVTWVSLGEARAYCGFYGKRLPNDWEWQFAAQNGTTGQAYPWGDDWDPSRVPQQSHGPVRPTPPDVGSFPPGASAAGVLDLMGLVWQWTNSFADAHTAAALVRGGAWYRANSSAWYFPGDLSPTGDVRAHTHNKLLTMSQSYDRHGTVGFRCVADAQ